MKEQSKLRSAYTRNRIKMFLRDTNTDPIDVLCAILDRGSKENLLMAYRITGSVAESAMLLGMSERSFSRLAKQHDIKFRSITTKVLA